MVQHEIVQHDVLITVLIIHGLAAFLLLGALTHQAIAVWVPPHSRVHDFPGYVRAVAATHYVNACIVVYLVTFMLGVAIYPDYKLAAFDFLDHHGWTKTLRGFEYKEDALGLGLALLPAYWYVWQPPLAKEHALARAMLTSMLAFVTWWSFLIGHLANNIAGLGVKS